MLISGVMGWILRELWTAVKELKDDLAELRHTIPDKYVQKIDYKDELSHVNNTLEKILLKLDQNTSTMYDKLDRKVDKPLIVEKS